MATETVTRQICDLCKEKSESPHFLTRLTLIVGQHYDRDDDRWYDDTQKVEMCGTCLQKLVTVMGKRLNDQERQALRDLLRNPTKWKAPCAPSI